MQQNKTASQGKTINPIYWVPTAYFAMGLPFIAINLVSVFMFKDLGISDTQITFWTSLIMMPWTLKFLWSPFLEMYRTKKFFVLVTELLSGILFGVVAFSLFFDYFFAISISTMAVIAFSGATHDIACDGVYMAELNKEDQAKYIGVQGAFYNVAKLVANGGLVALAGMLAEYFGAIEGASIDANKGAYSSAWMIIFAVIAAVMVLLGLYHIKMLPSTQVPATGKKSTSEIMQDLVNVIGNFFTKTYSILYLLHYSLPIGGRIYNEGCSFVSACLQRGRRSGAVIDRNRNIEWRLWFCRLCYRFIAGWNICCQIWIEENIIHALLRVQPSFPCLYFPCCSPADQSLSDRNVYHNGVLRLWFRICRTDFVHDAADCSGQTSDVTLCICFGNHESGSYASGNDQRLF